MYMLWFKFVFGLKFCKQFDFDFPLSFIYHNHLFIARNLERAGGTKGNNRAGQAGTKGNNSPHLFENF